MLAMIETFRRKLAAGGVYGPFSKTSEPGMIEALGYAGFDFVILDLEHGPNNILSVQNLLRAAELSGVFPIVRVKEDVLSSISEALDIGAGGILCPKVDSVARAHRIIETAKFAPLGQRGVCRFVRAARYSDLDRFDYFKAANQSLVILGLEGLEALAQLSDILTLPGVDIIFIGPFDLSQSLGLAGQIDHPEVEAKMSEVVECCQRAGISVGTFCETPKGATKWRRAGVRFISYGVDLSLFYQACHETAASLKALDRQT